MSEFIPPDARELPWLLRYDVENTYSSYLVRIFEVLRGHSLSHGMPHGLDARESTNKYEESLLDQIGQYNLEFTRRVNDEEYKTLSKTINHNTQTVHELYKWAGETGQIGGEIDYFLSTVIETYIYVSIAQ